MALGDACTAVDQGTETDVFRGQRRQRAVAEDSGEYDRFIMKGTVQESNFFSAIRRPAPGSPCLNR
jgi:hypothetical protein